MGYWDLRPLSKRQSQTQSRDLAGCMPWQSTKQSTCSSEQTKPDRSPERLWNSKTVMQVSRDKDMEQKRCEGGEYERWGIGQSLKDDRKHCMYFFTTPERVKPKSWQKSAGEASSATEIFHRNSSLFSETSSYFIPTNKTTWGNKILYQLFIQQVSGHNPDRYPSDNQARIGTPQGEKGPYRRNLAGTLCVQVSICLVFIWPVWGTQRVCQVCELTGDSSSGDVNSFTKFAWQVWRSLHLWW